MKSKLVAVTGGIGSGKSEVVKYLQTLGYSTLDCDVLAKEVACRSQVVEQVRALLGDSYISEGQLNRKAIREKVFADGELLKKYNEIFFAEVKNLLDERIKTLCDERVIFVEISVFDAFDYPWDEVWLVDADLETRISRTVTRDNTSRNTLEKIISRQNLCKDFTLKISNSSTIADLKKQVDKALELLIE